ncbi:MULTISPECIES: hypothetical protein [unclassified Rossellomorea]|uniref:hypothetical protein n=1 Tax=unclassified Rossellomorea TaxID=2837526 RepID=UPI0026300975|nr:hypothetical protein [uncultured Rossellomorea sp.]
MYSTQTLPQWFWLLYYSLILLTIASVFFSIQNQRDIWRAMITIFVTLSIPVVGFVNGIYREQNQNEWEQWLSHLGKGELWALYLLFGYIYVVVWWGALIRKRKEAERVSRQG